MRGMRALPLALLSLAALARGEATRSLTSAQMRGVEVWDQSYTNVRPGTPGKLRFTYQAQFKNGTPYELASITVKLFVDLSGRRAYEGPPITVTRFVNASAPIVGSVEPLNKTAFVEGLTWEIPAQLWRSDMVGRLVVVGASTFAKPDPHDPKHLYARLMTGGREADSLRLLSSDPSLLRVHDSNGLNTTLIAFAVGSEKVVRYVLDHGGDPRSQTRKGSTIMHMAAANPLPGVDDLALKVGGKPNARAKNGVTPLIVAIAFGCTPTWRWLLAHGARPDYVSPSGSTPAQSAIQQGQDVALVDLVRAGANPRTKDSEGYGWMHYAVHHHGMMDTVARAGVPVDDRNVKTGMTPLMLAAKTGDVESQAWLLQHGANPNLRDQSGRSAYDYARMSNTLQTDRFFRRLVARYARRRGSY